AQRLIFGPEGGECRPEHVGEAGGGVVRADVLGGGGGGSRHGGPPGIKWYRSVPLADHGTLRYHRCQQRGPRHPCQLHAALATPTPTPTRIPRRATASWRPPSRRLWKMATPPPARSKSPLAHAFQNASYTRWLATSRPCSLPASATAPGASRSRRTC